jgi:hypothetical protein
MTEREWLTGADPGQLLSFLRSNGRATERQLRLFAAGCCRRVWPWLADERSRQAVEVCEEYADGRVGQKRLSAARRAAFAATKAPAPPGPQRGYRAASSHAAVVALTACSSPKTSEAWDVALWTAGSASSLVAHAVGDDAETDERQAQGGLLRDIVGNPFRPSPPLDLSLLTWNAGLLPRLAREVYEERLLPQGTLDPARLAVLADALEEAGYQGPELLGHLRGVGPHVRGCFALDLVLGKV